MKAKRIAKGARVRYKDGERPIKSLKQAQRYVDRVLRTKEEN